MRIFFQSGNRTIFNFIAHFKCLIKVTFNGSFFRVNVHQLQSKMDSKRNYLVKFLCTMTVNRAAHRRNQ